MAEDINIQFINAFRNIDRNMVALYDDDDSGGWSQSRRCEGMFTQGGEKQGFKNIYFYVERGLEDKFAIIAETATRIIRYHRTNGHGNGKIILLSFGDMDDDLTLSESIFSAHMVHDAGEVAQKLCKLSGMEEVTGTATAISQLLPAKIYIDSVGVSEPGNEDLVCFIKSHKELSMSRNIKIKYNRFLKNRSIWATINDDNVNIEVSYVPGDLKEVL